MKKVLLASTALVLSAGFAAAEVSIGGGAGLWLSNDGDETSANNSISIEFSGSGETDGGLGFGFDYTLLDTSEVCTSDFTTVTTDLCANTGAAGVDNWEVYVSSGGFKLTVGDPDDADQMAAGMGDIGFDGLGVDNRAEQARGDSTGGVLLEAAFGDVTVYASHDSALTAGDDYALGVKVGLAGWTVGVGMNDDAGVQTTVAGIDGSIAGLGVDLYWEDSDASSGTNYGVVLSYDAGAATVSFGYADGDASSDAAMGIGVAYDLGGGAELAGGVADLGSDTVWDLGISMSF